MTAQIRKVETKLVVARRQSSPREQWVEIISKGAFLSSLERAINEFRGFEPTLFVQVEIMKL